MQPTARKTLHCVRNFPLLMIQSNYSYYSLNRKKLALIRLRRIYAFSIYLYKYPKLTSGKRLRAAAGFISHLQAAQYSSLSPDSLRPAKSGFKETCQPLWTTARIADLLISTFRRGKNFVHDAA